jgi:tetratricopeptide (TPR) repeat protein
MYEQAVKLHPGDYVLQSDGAIVFQQANRHQASLACAASALSLRPQDVDGRLRVSDALFFLGQLTDALHSFRVALAADPDKAEALYGVGLCLLSLGDHAGALDHLSRSLALVDDPDRRVDLDYARYVMGRATKDEIVRAMRAEVLPGSMLTYMYMLLDHPDPAKRGPDLVLELFSERETELASSNSQWLPRTVANVRMERWEAALSAMEGHFAPPGVPLLSPCAFEFVRSLIRSKLGQADLARECFARGMAQWKEVIGPDPAAWEDSDVARWRREAETALAK